MSMPINSNEDIFILDIGSREGYKGFWNNLKHPYHIIGLEPDLEECSRLNALNNCRVPRKSVRHYPCAIGDPSKNKPLYLYKDRRLSSFYLPNDNLLVKYPLSKLLSPGAFRIDRVIQLEKNVGLDQFVDSLETQQIDCIKLDTQGSELEILQSGPKTLSRCFAIQVEVEFQEIYKGQPLFAEVDSFLRSQGFALFDLQRHHWKHDVDISIESRGQLIFADALYMRDPFLSYRDTESLFWSKAYSDCTELKKVVELAVALGYSDFANMILNKAEEESSLSSVKQIKDLTRLLNRNYSRSNSREKNMSPIHGKIKYFIRKCLLSLTKKLLSRHLNSRFYVNDEFISGQTHT